ncbi:MAG: cell division protein FtsZ [Spirochaetaceae bacterium]|jgi:cell division protein FtsZ|nr:cell division protein FtsZ [Spirochaetaceae bacterium]
MLEFSLVDQDAVNPTIIKVIGCGGAGSNAVNRMIASNVCNVEFIAINTDLQALSSSCAEKKLGIGAKITRGLGAGGKPEIGEQAALEDADALSNMLRGSHMVFVTCGMGGGTGTGSAPIVAKIARDLGALTVAVVSKPFGFEGRAKMKIAEAGIEKLQTAVDTLIVIPNENLLKTIRDKDKELIKSVSDAFAFADTVLCQSVQGISDILTKPGLINADFNDVRTTMEGKGNAIMGTGHGSGKNRAVDAATEAINNPMLEDSSIDGAKNLLVNITGSNDFSLTEVEEIMQIITSTADPDALIKYGMVIDQEMQEEVAVTVIATGFNSPEKRGRPLGEQGNVSALSSNVLPYTEFTSVTRASLRPNQSVSPARQPAGSPPPLSPSFASVQGEDFSQSGSQPQRNTKIILRAERLDRPDTPPVKPQPGQFRGPNEQRGLF